MQSDQSSLGVWTADAEKGDRARLLPQTGRKAPRFRNLAAA